LYFYIRQKDILDSPLHYITLSATLHTLQEMIYLFAVLLPVSV